METICSSDRDEHSQRRLVADSWRRDGYSPITIKGYLEWPRRFDDYCRRHDLSNRDSLTAIGVARFARWYIRERGIVSRWVNAPARVALRAWSRRLKTLGVEVPQWQAPQRPPWFADLLAEFIDHRRRFRGVSESTVKSERWFVRLLLQSLRHRRLSSISARDLDRCIAQLSQQMARGSVADGCSAIRAFLRFLHATGKAPSNQEALVARPTVRRMERPPRALPWPDVRRILRAVNRSTAIGRRDYALLLLIAAYGLRAGEALQLLIDDVDFRGAVLRVHRSKTSTETMLPLLPSVARVLLDYLRRGRPRGSTSREVFLRARAPFKPLSGASAVTHLLRKHAAAAGVSAPFLGSHALRHSHAGRQVEAGVSPKVLGDILGHADPRSTSVYVRVPSRQLRALALPVPR